MLEFEWSRSSSDEESILPSSAADASGWLVSQLTSGLIRKS